MPIQNPTQTSNLLEVLEKILDKGVVIVGDIKIALADVDLLKIKIRLLVASVDKAREIGMDWWETDPYYSSKAKIKEKENALLLEKINRLEQLIETKALPLEAEDGRLHEPIGEEVLHGPIEKVRTPEFEETISVESRDQKLSEPKKSDTKKWKRKGLTK